MKFYALLVLLPIVLTAQNTQRPALFTADSSLTRAFAAIAVRLGLDRQFDTGEDGMVGPSLALVDLSGPEAVYAGFHAESFIYPASVYKMYVAAEVLHQCSDGRYALSSPVLVHAPNDVDRSKEIDSDPRPLLRDGDTVSVTYLLDLMITRSDNSAANCLIDLARREHINALMHRYNWQGSEVTRKFLRRKFEDSAYVNVRGTETCALHAAEFMYRIQTNQLVNPWVSQQMKALLGRQLDDTKLAPGLPPNAMVYHKTGWYASWTHDVGIVDNGSVRYIIACLLPIPEEQARPIMKELSRQVFDLIASRH